MKPGRRGFLKILAAAGIALTQPTVSANALNPIPIREQNQEREKFGEFWKFFTEKYVPAYNEWAIADHTDKNRFSAAWEKLNTDSRTEDIYSRYSDAWNELSLRGEKMDGFNLYEKPHVLAEYFGKHGKMYMKIASNYDSSIDTLLVGDIVKSWSEVYTDEGKNMPFNIVLFRQTNESIDNILGSRERVAFWVPDSKTAYLNLNETEYWAGEIYNIGMKGHPKDFREKAGYRLFKVVNKKAMKNPDYKDDAKKAFNQVFIDMLVESTIRHHEPAHEFYPYSTNPRINAENEAAASRLQAKNCPEYKAWVEFCGIKKFD